MRPAYLYYPLSLVVIYGFLALLNYYFGFFQFPEIRGISVVYWFLSFLLFAVFAAAGLGSRNTFKPVNMDANRLRLLVLIGLSFSAVGYGLVILDSMRGGISLEMVIEETHEVRKLRETSILSTLSVLFAFWWLPAAAGLAYMVYVRIPVGWIIWSLFALNGSLIVIKSIYSVHRNPILNFILIVFFIIVFSGRLRLQANKMAKYLIVFPVLAIFVLLFFQYSASIAIERRGFQDTVTYREMAKNSRYDLTSVGLPLEYENFLVSGSYYLSHQLTYTDAALSYAGPVGYAPQILNGWLFKQVMRHFPEIYYRYVVPYGYRVYIESGIPTNTWPGLLGHLMHGFGWLIAPLGMAAFGYFFGKAIKSAYLNADLFSFTLVFLFYQYACFVHKSIESSQFIFGLWLFLALIVFRRLLRFLSKYLRLHEGQPLPQMPRGSMHAKRYMIN